MVHKKRQKRLLSATAPRVINKGHYRRHCGKVNSEMQIVLSQSVSELGDCNVSRKRKRCIDDKQWRVRRREEMRRRMQDKYRVDMDLGQCIECNSDNECRHSTATTSLSDHANVSRCGTSTGATCLSDHGGVSRCGTSTGATCLSDHIIVIIIIILFNDKLTIATHYPRLKSNTNLTIIIIYNFSCTKLTGNSQCGTDIIFSLTSR